MEAFLFVKSMGLGLAVAAPIGPVGVLCITRTLAAGRLQGVLTGVGVAVADMLVALIAVLGLSAVASFLDAEKVWLRLAGGAFLALIGLRMLLRPRMRHEAELSAQDYAHLSMSGFFMAATNPATLLAFTGLMAALGVRAENAADGALVVAGVFTGSMLWWVILSLMAGLLRGWLSNDHLRLVNRCLGGLLTVSGLAVVAAAVLLWMPAAPP